MNKKIILRALLILMPVLAIGLATTVDSVTVLDTVTGQTQYYSYFELIPVTNMQMLAPLAAVCSALSGILAAVYLVKKSPKMLSATGFAALASAVLAAIPPVIRGTVLVFPNVALPIFMLVHYGVTRYLLKQDNVSKETGKPHRLPKR